MILYGERKELERGYEQWLKDNPEVKDCTFNVISYLALIGRLKEKDELQGVENNGRS